MADGVKRARLDGDKEIYLAELLGVNIADAHTTVNEVPRSSGMPTWRIATNIPMTTWIVLMFIVLDVPRGAQVCPMGDAT